MSVEKICQVLESELKIDGCEFFVKSNKRIDENCNNVDICLYSKDLDNEGKVIINFGYYGFKDILLFIRLVIIEKSEWDFNALEDIVENCESILMKALYEKLLKGDK